MPYYFSGVKPASDNRHTVRYRRVKGSETVVRDTFDYRILKTGKLLFSIGGTGIIFDGAADSPADSVPAEAGGRFLFDKFSLTPAVSAFTLDDVPCGTLTTVKLKDDPLYIIHTDEQQDGFAFHYCLEEVPSFGAGLMRCVRATGDPLMTYGTKVKCRCGEEVVLWDSISEMHGKLLSLIRLNVDGVVNEYDSEFLHDLRVSVRRLRSAMSLIKGVFTKELEDRYRGKFSYLGELSGHARDMDVYMSQIDGYAEHLPDGLKAGMEPVRDHFAGIRAAEYEKLKSYLLSAEFSEMLDAWQKISSSRAEIGVKGFVRADKAAARALKKSFMLADRLTAALFVSDGIQDIHSVRIAFKKLRYCVEFFSDHLGDGRAEDVLSDLRNLQDCLGVYNDLCVQCGHMNDVLAGMTDPIPAAACGYILSVLTDQKKRERQQCLALIKTFRDRKKRIAKALRI